MRTKKGGSLASDNVESLVSCKAFSEMNTAFDNKLNLNFFKGGALVKTDEIEYKIFNQNGGQCATSPNSTVSLTSMYPPNLSTPGVGSLSDNIWNDVPRGVIGTMSQPTGLFSEMTDRVVYPSYYTNYSPQLTMFQLGGKNKGKVVFPHQDSPKRIFVKQNKPKNKKKN